jgi:acyl dehydratase
VLSDGDLERLRSHRFASARGSIEHWENWLLTDCTQRAPMPDGLLHPIAMFHLPLATASVSIGDLFALGGAVPEPGAVTLLGYDWEYLSPLREGVSYEGGGGVGAVVRVAAVDGTVLYDDVDFEFRLTTSDGALAATATHHWRFRRSAAPHSSAAPTPSPAEGSGAGGRRSNPRWEVVADGGRMKTMAALLRDPYPIHWDPEASRAAGYDGRAVNQGPLNVGYVANMLMNWAGPASVRRLSVRFHGRVFDGDRLVAGGEFLEGSASECNVWLDRTEPSGAVTRILSGTATVTPR